MDNPKLADGYTLHVDGYLLVPLRGKHGSGQATKVDPDDYDKVSAWRWYVNHHGYSYGQRRTSDRISLQVFMHHLILATPKDMVCDHINGDRLDNRKSNLRVTGYATNNRNRSPRGWASQYKGITLDKRRGRWLVRIKWQGRNWNFGSYESEVEAARVYDAAALFLDPAMGDHALNFPGESSPVSPYLLRRQAFENGNIRRKSSQFKGVHWKSKNRAFQAFHSSGETVYLGLFDSEEEAARAHDSYALWLDRGAEVNFADSTPRSRDEILEGSLRYTRTPRRAGAREGNRHGYAGVVRHARASNRCWQARVHIRGLRISLGYFETAEAAARAYDAALVRKGLEPVNF